MKNQDIDRGLSYFRSKAENLGSHPNEILLNYNVFINTLSKDLSWSLRESRFFVAILILNDILTSKDSFLFLTHKGYEVAKGEDPGTLLINFKEAMPYDPKASTEKNFYQLWDIIGVGKNENPFYVDGKVFFDTAKRFIDGLPPSYSIFTKKLNERGEDLTRSEWCLNLFKSIPQGEIPVFLDTLSKEINIANLNKREDSPEGNVDNLFFPATEETVDNQAQFTDMGTQKPPKIFISHNTGDAEYAKAIVDLLTKLGVDESRDVFCSSLPGCGVEFGADFIDTIRRQYENHELIMIFIHSPRYYNSHISLCEMGAAWIMKNEHRSFLTQDCEFEALDAVVPRTETAFKAGQENTYPLLNNFKEFIDKKFGLTPKTWSRWETIKSDFITAVTT